MVVGLRSSEMKVGRLFYYIVFMDCSRKLKMGKEVHDVRDHLAIMSCDHVIKNNTKRECICFTSESYIFSF